MGKREINTNGDVLTSCFNLFFKAGFRDSTAACHPGIFLQRATGTILTGVWTVAKAHHHQAAQLGLCQRCCIRVVGLDLHSPMLGPSWVLREGDLTYSCRLIAVFDWKMEGRGDVWSRPLEVGKKKTMYGGVS